MTTSNPDPTPPAATRSPARLIVLVVLSAVLLTALVLAAVGLTSRAAPGLGLEGQPQQVQREREDVMAQAEQFMLRINTYGPDLLEGTTMPTYRDLVMKVITPKFDTDFEKNVPAAEATVVQAGLGRTSTVLSTGVSTLDSDSATVLVAGSFTNSYPKTPGSTERITSPPSPYRVQADLVRVKGEWLVDNFNPVTGLPTEQGQQPLDPSSVPTIDPSLLPSTPPSADPTSVSSP